MYCIVYGDFIYFEYWKLQSFAYVYYLSERTLLLWLVGRWKIVFSGDNNWSIFAVCYFLFINI